MRDKTELQISRSVDRTRSGGGDGNGNRSRPFVSNGGVSNPRVVHTREGVRELHSVDVGDRHRIVGRVTDQLYGGGVDDVRARSRRHVVELERCGIRRSRRQRELRDLRLGSKNGGQRVRGGQCGGGVVLRLSGEDAEQQADGDEEFLHSVSLWIRFRLSDYLPTVEIRTLRR